MISVEREGLELLQFESTYLDDDVFSFVTTRNKAKNDDPYSSFNLGLYSGGNRDEISRNLKQLSNVIGISPENIFLPHQVHGVKIGIIDEDFMSFDADSKTKALNGIDALITNIPFVVIVVTTADCVPVLLYDTKNKVIAAVHAGWRGTVGHIVRQCVEHMSLLYKTRVEEVKAMIGPSISPGCFEVGDEVIDIFRSSGYDLARISFLNRDSNKYHINLWEANRLELTNAGVPHSQIEISQLCTYTLFDRFYSARRLSVSSGRFVTGIYLSGQKNHF